jgi:hypothetical protein
MVGWCLDFWRYVLNGPLNFTFVISIFLLELSFGMNSYVEAHTAKEKQERAKVEAKER